MYMCILCVRVGVGAMCEGDREEMEIRPHEELVLNVDVAAHASVCVSAEATIATELCESVNTRIQTDAIDLLAFSMSEHIQVWILLSTRVPTLQRETLRVTWVVVWVRLFTATMIRHHSYSRCVVQRESGPVRGIGMRAAPGSP